MCVLSLYISVRNIKRVANYHPHTCVYVCRSSRKVVDSGFGSQVKMVSDFNRIWIIATNFSKNLQQSYYIFFNPLRKSTVVTCGRYTQTRPEMICAFLQISFPCTPIYANPCKRHTEERRHTGVNEPSHGLYTTQRINTHIPLKETHRNSHFVYFKLWCFEESARRTPSCVPE